MEFIKFCFSNYWIWLGMVIILYIICSTIESIVKSIANIFIENNKNNKVKDKDAEVIVEDKNGKRIV